MNVIGKGGTERRKKQRKLEPWEFDRRKPMVEELAKIRTLSDSDAMKFSADYGRKILEHGFQEWIKYRVVYRVVGKSKEE